MDPRLLRYYNQELRYLREMGAEFAREFPKIAGRLGMEGLEVADPYVERLIEGAAFLAARVQLKQDAEFPQLSQRLLEMVCPNMTAPVPAMLVARLNPLDDPNLIGGQVVPRGSALFGPAGAMSTTRCEFRTAQDVVLTPLSVAAVEYFLNAADLGLATLPLPQRPRSGLRIRLELPSPLKISDLKLDKLRFYLGGSTDTSYRLLELALGACVGVLIGAPSRSAEAAQRKLLPPQALAHAGFDDEEAMLPVTLRGLSGTRLLQEYFAFPQRFLFMDIGGIKPAFANCAGSAIEVVLLFDRHVSELEGAVGPDNVMLHCVPAINLFERRAERMQAAEGSTNFHVVPERTAPTDFEVFDILEVSGFTQGTERSTYLPLFFAPQRMPDPMQGYYSALREPRVRSDRNKREGPRSAYVGTEVHIALVDSKENALPGPVRELSARVRCTNRDLPLFMPAAAQDSFALGAAAPVQTIDLVAGPSRPLSALREGGIAWRLLALLSLNYLSLVDHDATQGAVALRELLSLISVGADVSFKRQIEGLRSVASRPVVRRHPTPGPITFARGLEITLTVDDMSFEGGSSALLGSVLHRWFGRHVSMNSFVQTDLHSMARGPLVDWPPQLGQRLVL